MFRRTLSWILCACILVSLAGCGSAPQETQEPATQPSTVPQTTAPPETLPAGDSLYAQARQAVDNADNLILTVTIDRLRSVGGESYRETATQTISLQGIGTDAMTVAVENSTTMNSVVLSSREFFSGGQVWMMFDNLPFTAQLSQEDYLARFLPAMILNADLYGSITTEAANGGYLITFAEPTGLEAWLVGAPAELISAQGCAFLDETCALKHTDYTVSYRYGSTRYDETYTVSVTIPGTLELQNTLPAAEDAYIQLEFIDAPWVLSRAYHDIQQTANLSYTSVDTMITHAGGAIFIQQETLDLFGTGPDTLSNYKVDITLQGQAGILDEYTLIENIQDKTITLTENDDAPISQQITGTQVEDVRKEYVATSCDFLWTPEDITAASIEDLGSVYLLQLEGSDALGDIYEGAACNTFWGQDSFLRDLASAYRTDTLSGYLSIDKYSGLPAAFGFTFEGTHTIDGAEYQLTDQWDQTFFPGSNTAYEAITEKTAPDAEPETKATPLFYHVTGENGQEMWLFGTIHVGDDRTGFLPQEIFDALLASDALAVEFDMDAFEEAMENDEALIGQLQAAYFYSDGTATKDHLDPEVYEDAVKLLKATGSYNINAEYMKPCLWSQSIENFLLRQGYGLTSEKGVDNRLLKFARENNMEIRDIESGLAQLQMMTGYSPELQELLLEDSLYTDSAEYCDSVEDLYEKWCAGDEAVLREELSDEVDTSELTEEELAEYEETKYLLAEYNQAMSYDRNDGMLKTAIEYLESGETVFYAVGLAHLLNNVNGLVDTLREAGYTVELVTYG